MVRELSPTIVKHVCREWLASKEAVLVQVLDQLAASLTPIAARESAELLATAIDTSEKERRIELLEDTISDMLSMMFHSVHEQSARGGCPEWYRRLYSAIYSVSYTKLRGDPLLSSNRGRELLKMFNDREEGGAA